jgi:II/X family phage/plasmid replication protein
VVQIYFLGDKKMIDTIRIFSMIDKNTYDKIKMQSIIKTSYKNSTGEIFYEIINDKLEGSFSSSLSVRVDHGGKFGMKDKFVCIIEGSLHKIELGYNALNGFYNIYDVSNRLIKFVENGYNVKLPHIKHWFLQRVDISKCFDLENNDNVRNYINNLSHCTYPRRNIKHYQDESIYMSGTTTTLKIYNKLLEFKKHDLKKLVMHGFNVINFNNLISGFVRFECEIKKKMLVNLYNKKYIRLRNIRYEELEKVWRDEFMKLIKMFENDMEKVKDKRKVEKVLNLLYPKQFNKLYNFYISICVDGLENVKLRTPHNTYYRYIKLLKLANIDFSQQFDINFEDKFIDFNPFDYPEVI